MVSHISTFCFVGIEVKEIDVQTHIANGLPSFCIVGLPNKAVAESKERVRAAFASVGLSLPMKRIIINLSPADLLKEGSHFDLPIALGLLVELDIIPQEEIMNYVAMGELSLDGRLTKIVGALPAAIGANALGKGLICPSDNGVEAAWSGNKDVYIAENLIEILNHFTNKGRLLRPNLPEILQGDKKHLDLHDIRGQVMPKRVLEIAAAGGHHMLMIGPPGSGKSMLAKRLPSIMPPLSREEKLEYSIIASIAGQLNDNFLIEERPFREPHCSSSMPAIVGGGKNAKPGEVTLAHLGVLFLDELPEFSRNVLESLRQPIESGYITIARVNNHITYPANFQLIAAMNPCRCGYYGESSSMQCSKVPKCVEEYQNKISGPLFDRFDLRIEVSAINILEEDVGAAESSCVVAKRVMAARLLQHERHKNLGIKLNSELNGEVLYEVIAMDNTGKELLNKACAKMGISMRGFNKILRVARTIADLAAEKTVNHLHISEALGYRMERNFKI